MATRSHELRIASFFAGFGGLDLGVRDALLRVGASGTGSLLGATPRHVLYVEREIYAARVLASRMGEGSLPSAPIWSDVRTVPDGIRADLAIGGFPCQDISCAGNVEGIHGKKSGLFFDMLDAACRMGCRYLFLENVPNIRRHGLSEVLGALAEKGFDAKWTTLRASDIGASHKRERWFLMAYHRGERLSIRKAATERREATGMHAGGDAPRDRGSMADADGVSDQRRGEPGVVRGEAGQVGREVPELATSDDRREGSGTMADPGRVGGQGHGEGESAFPRKGLSTVADADRLDGRGGERTGSRGEGRSPIGPEEELGELADAGLGGRGGGLLEFEGEGQGVPGTLRGDEQLADAGRNGGRGQVGTRQRRRGVREDGQDVADASGLDDGERKRLGERDQVETGSEPGAQGLGEELADADGRRLEGQREPELGEQQGEPGDEPHGRGDHRELVGPFAPGPRDPRWGEIVRRWPFLAPALGNSEGFERIRDRLSGGGGSESSGESGRDAGDQETESLVRRVANGVSHRVDQLRGLGNAVIPLQAEEAFLELWAEILDEAA